MTWWRRFVRFNVIGLVGVGVQLVALSALVGPARWRYVPATVVAVGITIVHNFVWHWWWTWRDRRPSSVLRAGLRFAAANGALSLVGNLGVMTMLVAGSRVHPVVANAVAIAACGVMNFWIGNVCVFTSYATEPAAARVWRTIPVSPDNAARGARCEVHDPKRGCLTGSPMKGSPSVLIPHRRWLDDVTGRSLSRVGVRRSAAGL